MDFVMIRTDFTTGCRDLREIWKQSFPNDMFFGDEVWQDPSVETYLVIVDGMKVGFTTFQLHTSIADTYDQDGPRETGTMYLLVVALKPEFRGRGLGTQVMLWHIEYAKQRGDIQKLVSNHRVSNTASHKFHLKAGHTQVGVKPNYYPKPQEDSIVMQYVL